LTAEQVIFTLPEDNNDVTTPLSPVRNVGSRSSREEGTMAATEHVDAREGVGYRGPQVCQIVGITYRQLDYWARTDLVRPSLADAHGSGTKRAYSYRDLVVLKVIKDLLDAGLSLQAIRQAIDYLRRELGADVAAARLVISPSSVALIHGDGDIIDLLRRGQGVFNIVPLDGVVEQLDAAITELRPTGTIETLGPNAGVPGTSRAAP
jgi:DNA-binding transcriptional MerR regulator